MSPDGRGPSPEEQGLPASRSYMWRPLDTAPATVHEIITRQKVEDLATKVIEHHTEISGELGEVRNRVNGLIFVVIAAVLVQIVGKAGGWL